MMGENSLSADNVISQLISFINQTSVYLWLRAHSCGHRNIDSSIATSIARGPVAETSASVLCTSSELVSGNLGGCISKTYLGKTTSPPRAKNVEAEKGCKPLNATLMCTKCPLHPRVQGNAGFEQVH